MCFLLPNFYVSAMLNEQRYWFFRQIRGALVFSSNHSSDISKLAIIMSSKQAEKEKVLKEILPASLVIFSWRTFEHVFPCINYRLQIPSATGTAFLVIGSNASKCFFPLATYLIIAGSISLSIPILSVVFRALCQKIYADNDVDPFEAVLLGFVKHLGKLVVLVELAILLGGMILIGMHLGQWQYTNAEDASSYCEPKIVFFSVTFLSGAWVFVIGGCIIYLILSWTNRQRHQS